MGYLLFPFWLYLFYGTAPADLIFFFRTLWNRHFLVRKRHKLLLFNTNKLKKSDFFIRKRLLYTYVHITNVAKNLRQFTVRKPDNLRKLLQSPAIYSPQDSQSPAITGSGSSTVRQELTIPAITGSRIKYFLSVGSDNLGIYCSDRIPPTCAAWSFDELCRSKAIKKNSI